MWYINGQVENLVLRIRVEDFFYSESGDIQMNKKELFQELYDQTYINLRRFVQHRSRNLYMVDDILQEIYLETFRHIEELAAHENRVGWIYKTADYKIMKLNKVYDRNMSRELSGTDFEEPSIEDNAEMIINLDEYKRILREDEFALVMKKYIEGYSYKEIGQLTGNTVSGSKMKISRLIEKLRKNIGELSNKLFLIFL